MTYREILPVWWSMTWRAFLASLLVTVVLTVFGLSLVDVGVPVPLLLDLPLMDWIAFLLGILINFWATRVGINLYGLKPAVETLNDSGQP